MQHKQSRMMWAAARRALAGGVNSPVRAFKAVGGEPVFMDRGEGPFLIDVDGNRYVDFVLSWGPLILGHAPPRVVDAVRAALEKGFSFGAPTEAETRLAERLRAHVPSMEKLRFVNSGTEAAMSALRLARAFTRREVIVKIAGGYHGHVDALLVQAGSGATTLGTPSSPGVPQACAAATRLLPFNDLDAARALFDREGDRIACLIIEPVCGNMGVVTPAPGYLEGLRALSAQHGALLIFDEVMTGFRVAMGGAQAHYGVRPDLTLLGKVIGGGLPVGAYGGRADIMELLAPDGPVYQAGTLSGNPIAMDAGLATLECLETDGVFEAIAETMRRFCEGLDDAARRAGAPVWIARAGTMACLFFHDGPVRDYHDATRSDTARYARFFHRMLSSGVYFPPAQFEAFFMSAVHDAACLEHALTAAENALREP